MTPPRIFIAVAAHNRRQTAELCLPTLRACLTPSDYLVIYNDGSKEYSSQWLRQFADRVVTMPLPLGIEEQRKIHIQDFWDSGAEFLYLTDHDCIHDPDSLEKALALHILHGAPLTCLYDTVAHSSLTGNTTGADPDVIWRRYAPGVSHLYSRAAISRVMPHLHKLNAFDWQIPDLLGNRCAVSRTSYIDHIGYGGIRHPQGAGLDAGDRATNPTPWLIAKRAEIVSKLTNT